MMLDILLTNRDAVLEWLDAFAVPLAELRAELDVPTKPRSRAALPRDRIRLRF